MKSFTGYDNILNGVAKVASEKSTQSENDYTKDGLLICGNCNTPKQCRVSFMQIEKVVSCMCKCEQEKNEEEEKLFRQRQLNGDIRRMRTVGVQDKKLVEYTFANDDGKNKPISELSRRYVEKFDEIKKENYGLLFWGDVGTGKSFFAGCIANALIDRGVPVLATSITRLINQIFSSDDKNALIRDVCSYDLLIIDDVGAERSTAYTNEQVYTIIDERYKSHKPTIITTNIDPQTFADEKDIALRRTYDRMLEMCVPIKVEGQRRKEAGVQKANAMRKMLYGV